MVLSLLRYLEIILASKLILITYFFIYNSLYIKKYVVGRGNFLALHSLCLKNLYKKEKILKLDEKTGSDARLTPSTSRYLLKVMNTKQTRVYFLFYCLFLHVPPSY